MNATIHHDDRQEFDFKIEFRQRLRGFQRKSSNRPSYGKRRSSGPKQFNGIHRRRKKKITW